MELYHSYDKLEKMYGKQPTFNTYLHKLADSYINGEDLGDFDIEELENTPDFMMNVIYSSRKNDKYDYTAILKLCGEDVKKSYAVASTCLFRFYDRPEVISKVCKDFISLNKTGDSEKDYLNEETTEILVRTVRILKEDKKNIEDHLSDLIDFGTELNERYDYISSIYADENSDANDYGFKYICEKYNNNPQIMPFIAHKTLVTILADDYISDKIFDVSLKSEEYSDKLLHEAIGVVLKGDNDYAGYVECNPLLFQEVQKRVKEKLDSCLFFQKQLRSKRHADDVNPIVTKIVKKLRK